MNMSGIFSWKKIGIIGSLLVLLLPVSGWASSLSYTGLGVPAFLQAAPTIDLGMEGEDLSVAIQALILVTVLSFGSAFITMMTSFTRIVIVFFFLRMGLGTQQSPPNKVLIGLALFLTIFIMMPTFQQVNDDAVQPYLNEEITQMEALGEASTPLKEFMVKQTREKELLFFMDMVEIESVDSVEEMPFYIVVPSFVMSELRVAFQIGFMIYLPFVVIDLVVSAVLLSMGIMFLPPVLVSLPFKILVFVLTDGWYLLVQSLVQSFN
ncbi:flagellar type III secretion system pore protein FliP [Fodinibius salsisoli]|uniref:Flagellar biosynthetic protein FliP n=1 Tax=Fodinibius salsisoli TaxID=2820877 RepID=A0ABT3PHH0_9BACT|nr:flagellar type III secretion system pore protein FliP [Fodinibius salsisoli]MCW9705365.1 flagellar type III secretion system pore protein FliP [Fodinibius salsisoli]